MTETIPPLSFVRDVQNIGRGHLDALCNRLDAISELPVHLNSHHGLRWYHRLSMPVIAADESKALKLEIGEERYWQGTITFLQEAQEVTSMYPSRREPETQPVVTLTASGYLPRLVVAFAFCEPLLDERRDFIGAANKHYGLSPDERARIWRDNEEFGRVALAHSTIKDERHERNIRALGGIASEVGNLPSKTKLGPIFSPQLLKSARTRKLRAKQLAGRRS